MTSTFSRTAVEAVCDIIEQHADRGGRVNTEKAWRDLLNLPLDPVDVQEIIERLEQSGFLWLWAEWMILVRPVRCPACNRWVEQRLTEHMRLVHPRRTRDVVWVEWA